MKTRLVLLFCLALYQLHGQSWTSVASLPTGYMVHHGFGFADGSEGYLVGGIESSGYSNRVYKYNPTTNTWTQIANFPGVARGYAIGDFYNGKAYYGFGVDSANNYLSDLWEFNPATTTWTQLTTCPCQARAHPALVVQNGEVQVGLGGSQIGNLKDWWVYNITSNTWQQKIDLPSFNRHHPYQFGIGNYVYTGLGHGASNDSFGKKIYRSWFRYDSQINIWTQMADLPAQGRVAGTQFSYNNKGYVLSGEGDNHASMAAGEFWSYDPTTNTWTQMPSHPGSSRWAPASFVLNGEVYLINGQVFRQYVSQNYKFNLSVFVGEEGVDSPKKTLVYPTVFNSLINVQLSSEELASQSAISIYNVNSQKVHTQAYSPQLDLSKLASGMYFMEVNTGTQKEIIKIIKQ